MPVRAERSFSLPRRKRVPWWVWALAVALHVPLAFLLVTRHRADAPPLFAGSDIVMRDSARAVPMPYPRSTRPPAAVASAAAAPSSAPRATPAPPLAATVTSVLPPVQVDTPPRGSASGLHPQYGDGRLWVQPLLVSPREIARTLTGKTDKELTDSAVTAMVQTYLDAMAKEQAQTPNALPSWTTKIGGKTVGLDSKWIYLGPLKIPTMLLALLPIMRTGNPTEAAYNAKLQAMRSDLMEAARRAGNYEEFKKAVKDLHDQTERAREFKKNQRTPPDSGHHG